MTTELFGPWPLFPESRLWLAAGTEAAGDSEASRDGVAAARMDERDLHRWERFRPLDKKQQFLNSRLAIRQIVNYEFGESAHSINFRCDHDGRPRLLNSNGDESNRISMSHSGAVIAVVISNKELRFGVDVEIIVPLRNGALQNLVLGEREKRWFDNADISDNAGGLLAAWTAKEAIWKALGGPRNMSSENIVADFQDKVLRGRITHPEYLDSDIRLQLFGTVSCPWRTMRNYTRIETEGLQHLKFLGCLAYWKEETRLPISAAMGPPNPLND